MCNNYLPIETLRWYNVDRNDRTCPLCNSLDVCDEYHYLFTCSQFSQLRKQLLLVKYLRNKNTLNYCSLMNENDETILFNLCKFVSTLLKCFQWPNFVNCNPSQLNLVQLTAWSSQKQIIVLVLVSYFVYAEYKKNLSNLSNQHTQYVASPGVELRTPGVADHRSYSLIYHIDCRGMLTHAQQHPLFIKKSLF